MKNKTAVLIPLLLSVLLIVEGCSPAKQAEVSRAVSSDRIVKRMEASRRKIKEFTGSGTISIKTDAINAKSSFQVELKKPDSVKISLFGPFGIDLASALVTQKDFQFLDYINNTLIRGKVKPGVMKEILKVEIQFTDLVDILTGSVNLTDKLRSESDKVETVDDMYKMTYRDSVTRNLAVYFVKIENLEIREYQKIDSKGNHLLDASFSNFKKIDDLYLPGDIKIIDKENNQQIIINYNLIDVNKDTGKLKLDIPNDTKTIEW